MATLENSSATVVIPPRRNSTFATVWRVLKPILHKPSGFIGFMGVVLIVLIALFGPILIPAPKTDVDNIRAGPTAAHPLGTDNNGKDILILLMRGGTDVIIIAFGTGILTTFIAVTLGSLAAYLGGTVDRVVSATANFLLTIPTFVLLSVLATVRELKLGSPLPLMILLSLLLWPSLMRTIRSQVLSLRERDYVEAAVALDLGTRHIIMYEILPNMASYIIINMIFVVTSAIYNMTALIFLGFVPISTSTPNWGVTLFNANTIQAIYNDDTVWWMLAPVFVIAFLQWFLITLARSIEDAFNPRLKSGA